jgi:hypothetical protein
MGMMTLRTGSVGPGPLICPADYEHHMTQMYSEVRYDRLSVAGKYDTELSKGSWTL